MTEQWFTLKGFWSFSGNIPHNGFKFCLLVFRCEHGLQQTEEGQTRLLDRCWTQRTKLGKSAQLELGLLGDAEAKPAQQSLFKFPHCIPFVKHCYTFQLVVDKVSFIQKKECIFFFFPFFSRPLSPYRPIFSIPCSHLLLLASPTLRWASFFRCVPGYHPHRNWHGDISLISSLWWPYHGIHFSDFPTKP